MLGVILSVGSQCNSFHFCIDNVREDQCLESTLLSGFNHRLEAVKPRRDNNVGQISSCQRESTHGANNK